MTNTDRFDHQVQPELRPGLAALRSAMVTPDRRPEVLAALRGTRLGSLSEDASEPVEGNLGVAVCEHAVRRADGSMLKLRSFIPQSTTDLPGILYIHGGGMIRGSIDREHASALQMAANVGAAVVSVEYRLAPEHPHPAPVDDCYAALLWLEQNANELRVDRDRLAVAGASAGGGLATAVALQARDRQGPVLRLQALTSPMLDDRTPQAPDDLFDGIPGWNNAMNEFGWTCLLGEGAGLRDTDAYAAPARARHLNGLPPTFLMLGQLEVFRQEALAFAMRLALDDVPVELHMFPGAYHGWEPLNPNASVSRAGSLLREKALRTALHSDIEQRATS